MPHAPHDRRPKAMHHLLGRLAIEDSVRHFSIAKLLAAKKLGRRPFIIELLITDDAIRQVIKMRDKASLARYHFQDDELYVDALMTAYKTNQKIVLKYFLRQNLLRHTALQRTALHRAVILQRDRTSRN
jgi:hypothetical protein